MRQSYELQSIQCDRKRTFNLVRPKGTLPALTVCADGRRAEARFGY